MLYRQKWSYRPYCDCVWESYWNVDYLPHLALSYVKFVDQFHKHRHAYIHVLADTKRQLLCKLIVNYSIKLMVFKRVSGVHHDRISQITLSIEHSYVGIPISTY